jgi:hypothetical protein
VTVLAIIASGLVGAIVGCAVGVAAACHAEDGWALIFPLGCAGIAIGGVLGAVVGALVL